jgi:hypothetical protein
VGALLFRFTIAVKFGVRDLHELVLVFCGIQRGKKILS